MSNEVINAVSKLAIRPSGKKFVLIALANFADSNWVCYPAVRHISEFTSQADKTIRDHLDALETDGLIKRVRQRRKDGTLGRFFFQVVRSRIDEFGSKQQQADKFASGEIVNVPAAKSAAHKHHPNTSSLSLPSPEPASDEFDLFWTRYPQKVARPKALKSFLNARKKVELEVILLGLDRYLSKTDDRPWCNPGTWLDQERWADIPAVSQPKRVETKAGSKPENNSLQALSRRLLGGQRNG